MSSWHSVTLTLPTASEEILNDLSDQIWMAGKDSPEVYLNESRLSISGWFRYSGLEDIIFPYLSLIDDVVWLVEYDEGESEYERVHNHQLEWCNVAPNEQWEPIVKETIDV